MGTILTGSHRKESLRRRRTQKILSSNLPPLNMSSRQKLAKGPDVICQACGHCWCALSPSRINRTVACPLVQCQLAPQAHIRSGDIIEGLKEDHPLPQAFAVFAEAGGLATQ